MLLIIRNGSGWGGYYGKWLVDIEQNVAYDISEFKSEPIKLSNMSSLLPIYSCELHNSNLISMDHQEDYAYILHSGEKTCVYDAGIGLYPADSNLEKELIKLIEYLTIVKNIDKLAQYDIKEKNSMFENEENRPDNCEECVNYTTCVTYYGSNICQKKWEKESDELGVVRQLKELLDK